MRRAARVDANHASIRDGLRDVGYDVCDLSDVGGGIPDLCVRDPAGGVPTFFEVKDADKPPSQRRLTAAQQRWRHYCGAITYTVTSLDEALTILRQLSMHRIPNLNTSLRRVGVQGGSAETQA